MLTHYFKKMYLLLLLLVAGAAIPINAGRHDIYDAQKYFQLSYYNEDFRASKPYIEFEYADYSTGGNDDAFTNIEISVVLLDGTEKVVARMGRCHDNMEWPNPDYGLVSFIEVRGDEPRIVKMHYYPGNMAISKLKGLKLHGKWDIDDNNSNKGGDDYWVDKTIDITYANDFMDIGRPSPYSAIFYRIGPKKLQLNMNPTMSQEEAKPFETYLVVSSTDAHNGDYGTYPFPKGAIVTLNGEHDVRVPKDFYVKLYVEHTTQVKNGSVGRENVTRALTQRIYDNDNEKVHYNSIRYPNGLFIIRNRDDLKADLHYDYIGDEYEEGMTDVFYRRKNGESVDKREELGRNTTSNLTEGTRVPDPTAQYLYEVVFYNKNWNETPGQELLRASYLADPICKMWEGEGTKESPYLIQSENDLINLERYTHYYSAYTEGVYFKQTDKITLSTSWNSIGKEDAPFMGVYDGCNFILKGLNVDDYTGAAGLFGATKNAEIKNLCIKDAKVSAISVYAGIIAGKIDNTKVTNCYVNGSVNSTSSYAGGMFGEVSNSSVIAHCSFEGDVHAVTNAAGFAAVFKSANTVTNCYSSATVSVNEGTSGAFTCDAAQTTFNNSVYDSTLAANLKGTGTAEAEGLIAATTEDFTRGYATWVLNNMTDVNPTWFQTIGTDNMPVADSTHSTVHQWGDNYFSNEAIAWTEGNGSKETPYLIAKQEQLRALESYVSGRGVTEGRYWKQTADLALGGSFNTWNPVGTPEHPFNGNYDGGGFKITEMSITNSSDYQGLFGYVSGTDMTVKPVIENILMSVSTLHANNHAGIIAGHVENATLRKCHVNGVKDIHCNEYVAGLVGSSSSSVFENCAFDGTVQGLKYLSGITCSENSENIITNCYTSVNINQNYVTHAGCISAKNLGKFTNCYYDSSKNTDIHAVGSDSADKESADVEGVTAYSAEVFKSGLITWLLNNSSAETTVWRQTLGEDKFPVLNPKHNVVYSYGKDYYSNAECPWTEGDGSAEAPYIIATEAQLRALAQYINDGGGSEGLYWKQTADIMFSEELGEIMTIGDKNHMFSGHYDGGGHSIQQFHIYHRDTCLGLFGHVAPANAETTDRPEIKNIVMENGDGIIAEAASNVGIIAGLLQNATVSHCLVKSVNVHGYIYAGGIAGRIIDSEINNCGYIGVVTALNSNTGGITGIVQGVSTIRNSYAVADVHSPYSSGVIAGTNMVTAENCYYLSTSTEPVYGLGFTDTADSEDVEGTVAKTQAQFESGEVTFLLNSGDNDAWRQNLMADTYPVLDPTHKKVFNWEGSYQNSENLWAEGNGTAEHPILIKNEEDLRNVAELYNSNLASRFMYFKQTADIDLGGEERPWTPIGTTSFFNGYYDGGGHTISNMFVSATSDKTYNSGLFAGASSPYTEQRIVIENIRIVNATVVSEIKNTSAILVGSALNTDIRNCSVEGVVNANDEAENVGGLVGAVSDVDIKNCSSKVRLLGGLNQGGLIGGALDAVITNCYSASELLLSNTVGALVGAKMLSGAHLDFSNCYYDSTLAGECKALGASEGDAVSSTDPEGVTPKTTQQFESGEVTYLLNNSDTDNPTWYQTIGIDSYPLLDATHGTVYKWQEGVYENQDLNSLFEGDGSSESPYLITSVEDWCNFARFTNNGGETSGTYWNLTSNVSFFGTDQPEQVGTKEHPFAGIFDGCGHSIIGAKYTSTYNNSGVFGYVQGSYDKHAVIKNVRMYMIDNKEGYSDFKGIVAVKADYVTFDHVYVSDSDIDNAGNAGFIVGKSYGSNFNYCHVGSSGSINANTMGGIAGVADTSRSTKFTHCLVEFSMPLPEGANISNIGSLVGSLMNNSTLLDQNYRVPNASQDIKAFGGSRLGNPDGTYNNFDLNGVEELESTEYLGAVGQLGIDEWNYASGPILKVFDPYNPYDVTLDENGTYNNITSEISGVDVNYSIYIYNTDPRIIQLPFDLPADQASRWGEFYTYRRYDAKEGYIYVDKVTTSIEAGKVYLLIPDGSCMEYAATNVTIKPTDKIDSEAQPEEGFIGSNYTCKSAETLGSDIYVPFYNKQTCEQMFKKVDPASQIKSFYGWVKLPANSVYPDTILLSSVPDVPTGIDEIDYTDGTYTIFDLSGRKLQKPVKGVNIINGKKVIIR